MRVGPAWGRRGALAGQLWAAVRSMVGLWLHKVRPGWVGLGLLRVQLVFFPRFLAFLPPPPLWCLLSYAQTGVSPRNVYQETKRKETDRKSWQKHMARPTASAQNTQAPCPTTNRTSRCWVPSWGRFWVDDTLSIMLDSGGSPVPSWPWALALSVLLHSVCSELCGHGCFGLICTGWAVALGLGPPWPEPCWD